MSQLTELRIRANLLQEEVAAALNINRSTVAKWETGVSSPRADKLPALARLYGCSIDELFKAAKDDEAKAV